MQRTNTLKVEYAVEMKFILGKWLWGWGGGGGGVKIPVNLHTFTAGRQAFHRRKLSDWSTRDHVTLPNSKWRQYIHRLFIPVERSEIAA